MVHALEKIYRLLKRGGVLIDIHPTPKPASLEVRLGTRTIPAGWINESDDYVSYEQADDAVSNVVERKVFTLERDGTFEHVVFADSVNEFREEYLADRWEDAYIDDITAARIEELLSTPDSDKELIFRESIRIMRLRRNQETASSGKLSEQTR